MDRSDYARIEAAIRFLGSHHARQPSLREVAEQIGLSPYHFQRLFKRWAGVSPKRFLQFLTVEYAKSLLAEPMTVLQTTYDVGLSSQSRLHDLFVTVEAVTPGEFKGRGRGLDIRYGFQPTPFGPCLIASTSRGICCLTFVTPARSGDALSELKKTWQHADLQEDRDATSQLVNSIFRPKHESSPNQIRLFLKGTNFQLKVWKALLEIPSGSATTYGQVARTVGCARGSRAVGSAVGRNPVAFLIPCHRVLQQVGRIGGYRWGADRKKTMLAWEASRRHREQGPCVF